jgi:general secretion pathway protein K
MRFNKKGTILVTSLWIMTILAIFAIGIGFRVSIEARLNKNNMDRLKGVYLAKAGIIKSQELLARDNNSYDSMRECGIMVSPINTSGEADQLARIFTERLGDGKITVSYDEEGKSFYGMMDEERKININKASAEVLKNLLGTNNEEAAESIVNWRSNLRLPKGASDDFYRSLTPPYECKHADFSVIEELMLVKGVTPQLFESIKDYITVYGDDGRININTATRKVMLSAGLDQGTVDIIMTIRNGPDRIAGTKDDGMLSGDIASQLSIPMTSPTRTVLENYFTTASNYFRIEAKGLASGSKIYSKVACIVKRGEKRLLYYREY